MLNGIISKKSFVLVFTVGVSGWKLTSMIEVECMVEGVTVKKAVILDCFAFLCMPLYAGSLGAMTASNLCSSLKHLSLKWSTSNKWLHPQPSGGLLNWTGSQLKSLYTSEPSSSSGSLARCSFVKSPAWTSRIPGCQCPPNLGNVLLKHYGLVQRWFLFQPPQKSLTPSGRSFCQKPFVAMHFVLSMDS